MSVCSCISVMKAIIAHPLRQTRHWNTGSAGREHHQQFDTEYHRKSSSRTCMIWPECGVISCIHDNIHRYHRHAGNHWKNEHDGTCQSVHFPSNLSFSHNILFSFAHRSYNPMKTHRIPHCLQQSQNDCFITFIMNKPRNPASWTHTLQQHSLNTWNQWNPSISNTFIILRNRTTFAHPEQILTNKLNKTSSESSLQW